jgi:hypothetical protein
MMGVRLFALAVGMDGEVTHASDTDLVFRPHEPYSVTPTFLELTEESAQRLLQDLWDAGYRPRAITDEPAVLSAKSEHIDDLRSEVGWLRKLWESGR